MFWLNKKIWEEWKAGSTMHGGRKVQSRGNPVILSYIRFVHIHKVCVMWENCLLKIGFLKDLICITKKLLSRLS